jgi:hypothetical protein
MRPSVVNVLFTGKGKPGDNNDVIEGQGDGLEIVDGSRCGIGAGPRRLRDS